MKRITVFDSIPEAVPFPLEDEFHDFEQGLMCAAHISKESARIEIRDTGNRRNGPEP
jgi:hypothetical protein